jgi:AcrR family transcriptional regulator
MPPRPYRSAVRAEAAEQTRRRIITAAVAILRAKGAGGFSLESVAKAAGVTRLTVYNQFGSRSALLEAVFDDRAAKGGLERVPQAMANPDTRAGLRDLVAVFCGFWAFDEGSLGSLHAAVSDHGELEESLRERNERRRKAIAVLAGRLADRGDIERQEIQDVTDLVFLLTSFHSYAAVAAGRTTAAACALLQRTVEDVLRRPPAG